MCYNKSHVAVVVLMIVYTYSIPARLGEGQGAKEIGHKLIFFFRAGRSALINRPSWNTES